MIKVIDNIIPEYIQDFIYNLTTSKIKHNPYPLHYYDNLTKEDGKGEIGFGHDFFQDRKICIGDPLLTPLFLFLTSQELILRELIQGRLYLQVPNFSQKDSKILEPHKDLPYDHLTMIYYVTDTDGDTYFYNDKEGKNIIDKISPKKGRIVFFNGNTFHSGSSPTQNLRIILNYNFLIWNIK
jgi:hypothetical protein